MKSKTIILIKIIILVYYLQSWRPIKCDYNGDDDEDEDYGGGGGGGGGTTSATTDNGDTEEPPESSDQAEAELDELMESAKDKEQDPGYSENSQWWENKRQENWFNTEWAVGAKHYSYEPDGTKICFIMGTSYHNAMQDIRHYFPMRFLYVKNLDYEVGFLTYEVIFKYQIMLEMFHIITWRYYHNQTRWYAPTTYMLYMYTHILQSSKQIIHLCNMMHEIENKYKIPPHTVWYDYHTAMKIGKKSDLKYDKLNSGLKKMQKRRDDEYKKRMRLLKRKRENFLKTGVYVSERRTRRRIVKNEHEFLHYGWSIEYW